MTHARTARILTGTGAAIALMVTAGCGSSASTSAGSSTSAVSSMTAGSSTSMSAAAGTMAAPSKLVFAGYGGTTGAGITKAWFDPYTQKTGTTITTDPTDDVAKLQQMVKAGDVTWDMVESGSDLDLTGGTLFENIDCKVVSCAAFTGGFKAYPQGVPWFIYSQVLAYNTDQVKTRPKDWSAFFDASIPGKRALNGDEGFRGILEAALLADGVPRDKLYPLDVKRALAKLDPIKDRIIYFDSGQQCVDDVATGEASMGNCYNGSSEVAKAAGKPINYIWGQQVQSADYLSIPKGSKNVAAAQQAIAYMTSAQNNGALSKYVSYGPPNPKATVDPSVVSKVPTSNELTGAEAPILPNQQYWKDNRDAIFPAVIAWKSS